MDVVWRASPHVSVDGSHEDRGFAWTTQIAGARSTLRPGAEVHAQCPDIADGPTPVQSWTGRQLRGEKQSRAPTPSKSEICPGVFDKTTVKTLTASPETPSMVFGRDSTSVRSLEKTVGHGVLMWPRARKTCCICPMVKPALRMVIAHTATSCDPS